MSRIEYVKCDRCGRKTSNVADLWSWMILRSYDHGSSEYEQIDKWDLCPICKEVFMQFLEAKRAEWVLKDPKESYKKKEK